MRDLVSFLPLLLVMTGCLYCGISRLPAFFFPYFFFFSFFVVVFSSRMIGTNGNA